MISIILPVYQVENYIENCIISICKQTYRNFEVILVNDGTKDDSIRKATIILNENFMSYKVINQKNMGVSAARNNGIIAAKGEWVICVDSDDILNEDFLLSLIEANISMGTNVSCTAYQMVDETNLFKAPQTNTKVNKISQKEILYRFLKRDIKLISPALLVKRDLLIKKNIFYEESMRFSEDVHWIWKLLFEIEDISYVTSELYNYNRRSHSTMTSSGTEKIMTGYQGFKKMSDKLQNTHFKTLKKHLFNRWVLGVINSSARMLTYKDFSILLKKMNYKKHLIKLLNFPDIKTIMLSLLLLISKRLFYISINTLSFVIL